MITCGAPTGRIIADGVPLHGLAWTMPDLFDLYLGSDVRGEDRIISKLPGAIPHKRRRTTTRHSLPLTICSDVLGETGAAWAGDPWAGIIANIDYLRANVIDPTNVGDGTRNWVLVVPGQANRTAKVHAERLVRGQLGQGTQQDGADGVIMRATLEISLPFGAFI